MWPLGAPRRYRRSPSPPFYAGYEPIDLWPRPYPTTFDTLASPYSYNYALGTFGLGESGSQQITSIEVLTRGVVSAQLELEKAKKEHDEAKQKMEDCEKKVKEANELLRAARCNFGYVN